MNAIPTHPLADSYATVAEADAYLASRSDAANYLALTTEQKEAQLKLATMQIDSFRFFGNEVFPTNNHYRLKQALKFPRTPAKPVDVTEMPSTVHVRVSALIDQVQYPDDLWNKGAMVVVEGTGRGNTLYIEDFISNTGIFTISNPNNVVVDASSDVYLIMPIEPKVKMATYEQALFNINGAMARAQAQGAGVKSYSIGDLSETFGGNGASATSGVLLSPEAKNLLSGLISRIGRIV